MDVKETKVKLDPQDQATIQERADEVHAAKFREVRAKLAEDCNKMTAYNTQVKHKANRTHVVEVMHLKSQNAAGQKPFGRSCSAAVHVSCTAHLASV